jgi:LmbE family N-acetylglucosaminyl deacetylase
MRSGVAALAGTSVGALQGRVVVVSPHCDDAVLSLGSTLTAHVRQGGRAVVVTAMAGDPHSDAPAGPWDAAAGFSREGEATVARRSEDRAACRRIGAEHLHIDEVDAQYPRRRSPDALWRELRPALDGCDDLLLPGFPLRNSDHLEVTRTVLTHLDPRTKVRLYLEEPYALRERGSTGPADVWGGSASWGPLPTQWRDAVTKLRATRCYDSQLPLLARERLSPPSAAGGLVLQLELLHAARTRGEWCTPPLPAGLLAQALGTGHVEPD